MGLIVICPFDCTVHREVNNFRYRYRQTRPGDFTNIINHETSGETLRQRHGVWTFFVEDIRNAADDPQL